MVNRFTLAGLLTVLSIFGLGALVFSVADGSEPAPIEAEATTPPSPIAAAPAEPTATATATPAPKATPLQSAAKAAGCELKSPPNEGAEHVPQPTTAADYGSNPPTSGIHAPDWAPDGVYDRKSTPALGVHRPRARARPDRHPVRRDRAQQHRQAARAVRHEQ